MPGALRVVLYIFMSTNKSKRTGVRLLLSIVILYNLKNIIMKKGGSLLLHSRVALAAIYRSVVAGLEGNSCFFTAVCTYGGEHFS